MALSNTQDLESAPLSTCRCIPTTDTVANRDTIKWPSIKIVRKRDAATLLTVTKDIACTDSDQSRSHQFQKTALTSYGSSLWRG